MFRHILHKKNNLLASLNSIQTALENKFNRSIVKLECKLQNELDGVLTREELL